MIRQQLDSQNYENIEICELYSTGTWSCQSVIFIVPATELLDTTPSQPGEDTENIAATELIIEQNRVRRWGHRKCLN